ncbi:unnamed protein product, partial [Discosporangium mesarthrocarpum]
KVRDCSVATFRAMAAVIPVLMLELLVTLAYSCVCVVLYHSISEAPFTSLFEAFVNLFALSTTVNDPDVWMPLYDRNIANVLVFSSFLILQVFLLHNIVLAQVWNEFGERMKVYAAQNKEWREEAVRRAFDVLDVTGLGYIPKERMLTLLRMIRPHYSHSKLLMMYERMVQGNRFQSRGSLDADIEQVQRKDFYSNVVEAVSLRIRTLREKNIDRLHHFLVLPLLVWNMLFVLTTCLMSPWIFSSQPFVLALVPTSVLLGASVLIEMTLIGVRAYVVLPWNRVQAASLMLTLSGFGWYLILTPRSQWDSFWRGQEPSVEMDVAVCLLMSARCLDLGSLLRNFHSIHSVVSIMYTITPNLFAQAGVIFTIFHVYAYLGMALFGGLITPDRDYGDTTFANSPYYYDNNFNSYPESLVTLFELLVVNNWNVVISGYVQVSPLGRWTYVFFMSFIILAVTVALNVLTAIFMNAFTATSNKANIPARRSVISSYSISSQQTRTALGAGASLALRPNPSSYFSNFYSAPPFPPSPGVNETIRTTAGSVPSFSVGSVGSTTPAGATTATNKNSNSNINNDGNSNNQESGNLPDPGTQSKGTNKTNTMGAPVMGGDPHNLSRQDSRYDRGRHGERSSDDGRSSGEIQSPPPVRSRSSGGSGSGSRRRLRPPTSPPHKVVSIPAPVAGMNSSTSSHRWRPGELNKSPRRRAGSSSLTRQRQSSVPEGEVVDMGLGDLRESQPVSPGMGDDPSSVANDPYLGWGGVPT